MITKLATIDDLNRYIAAGNSCPDFVRDRFANTWALDETEEGDWQGVRPRRDDDQEEGPGEDVWRPIGPTPVQHMEFPLTIATVDWGTEATLGCAPASTR